MKKRLYSTLICAIILITLTACTMETTGTPGASQVSIYRVIREEHRDGSELVRAEKLSYSDPSSVVRGAAVALKGIPEDAALQSALPAGVSILNAEQSGKTVTVTMNGAYDELTGMDKTLTDSCITLTMCSIPGVDRVSIYSQNKVLQKNLSSEDLVLRNTVVSSSQAEIRLYFPQTDAAVLSAEHRTVSVSSDVSSERIVIDELLKGPVSEALRPALPQNMGGLSVDTQGGLCTVSFSESFLQAFEDEPEAVRLAIYSIVNSLTSLTEIDSVQIIIQNSSITQIGGIDISEPLTRKLSVIGSAVID